MTRTDEDLLRQGLRDDAGYVSTESGGFEAIRRAGRAQIRRRRSRIALAAAAAVVVVGAVTVVAVSHDERTPVGSSPSAPSQRSGGGGDGAPGGRVDLAGAGTENVVDPVLATPGVRKAPLIADGRTVGQAALTPDGDGVLYDLTLPAPGPGEHLWVWIETDESLVPIGEIPDPSVDTVHFMVSGDASKVWRVWISVSDGAAAPLTPDPLLAQAEFLHPVSNSPLQSEGGG